MDTERMLISIGISSHNKGFHYILKALELLRENPKIKLMDMYEAICNSDGELGQAKHIERAIRHCVRMAYKNNDMLSKIYAKSPMNSAFLCDLAFQPKVFENVIKESLEQRR